MSRTGTRPEANKTNYLVLPTVPATQKLGAPESNWVHSKAIEPGNEQPFPVSGNTVSVEALDEIFFEEYTQVAQLDFVSASSVQSNEGAGNGLFGIIVASGDDITFDTDFDLSIPSTFVAAQKYIVSIKWNGVQWIGFVRKVGNVNADDIQETTRTFLDSSAAPQTIEGVKDFSAQVKGGDVTEAFSATKTFDMNNGNMQKMILTGNVTSLALSNKVNGSAYYLILEQGGAGGYSIAGIGASFGTPTDNSVDSADWPTTLGSKLLITIFVEPDGDTEYSIEIKTV